MADNEIIGRMTCPICGLPAQDVKINKNGNLYCNTDCNHSIRFNGKDSKNYIPDLRAGKSVKLSNGQFLRPVTFKSNEEKTYEIPRTEPRRIATDTGASVGGRTDREYTPAAKPAGTNGGGILGAVRSFLSDDVNDE